MKQVILLLINTIVSECVKYQLFENGYYFTNDTYVNRLIGWLTDRLILIDWIIEGLVNWLID